MTELMVLGFFVLSVACAVLAGLVVRQVIRPRRSNRADALLALRRMWEPRA